MPLETDERNDGGFSSDAHLGIDEVEGIHADPRTTLGGKNEKELLDGAGRLNKIKNDVRSRNNIVIGTPRIPKAETTTDFKAQANTDSGIQKLQGHLLRRSSSTADVPPPRRGAGNIAEDNGAFGLHNVIDHGTT